MKTITLLVLLSLPLFATDRLYTTPGGVCGYSTVDQNRQNTILALQKSGLSEYQATAFVNQLCIGHTILEASHAAGIPLGKGIQVTQWIIRIAQLIEQKKAH